MIEKQELSIPTRDQHRLSIILFKPDPCWKAPYPCILFFYGGGFVKRNRAHFFRQSEALAQQGILCLHPDYRLASETGTLKTCFEDAEDAFTALLQHADSWQIDPQRIVLSGGSAGGSLACHLAQTRPEPLAQILFNPILFFGSQKITLVPLPGTNETLDCFTPYWGDDFRHHPQSFSAYHQLEINPLPPTLIFQGTSDSLAYPGVLLFQQKAEELGMDCQSVFYAGQRHGFFNYDKIEDKFYYFDTLNRMQHFLAQQGFPAAVQEQSGIHSH